MKNKIVIIVLIISGIALGALVGVYFSGQKDMPAGFLENEAQQDQGGVPANSVSENAGDIQGEAKSGAGMNDQKNIQQPQSKLVTDDFEVSLPVGWKRAEPPMGASAMAVNMNEDLSDPAAKKINFKSYFAVSYDTLQGNTMDEYAQIAKDGFAQVIPSVVFTKDQDMAVNGSPAHAIEAELTQKGVNFKILMVMIAGQGEDVWTMSFNTTKSDWDGYREVFYNIVNSFSLKK